jgi:hypothetical protein
VVHGFVVLERFGINEADLAPIRELEPMQMRQIPAPEPLVDRVRQRREGVRRPTMKIRSGEGSAASRGRPEDQPNLKPRPRRHRRTLRHTF